jgi:hypothetical protein
VIVGCRLGSVGRGRPIPGMFDDVGRALWVLPCLVTTLAVRRIDELALEFAGSLVRGVGSVGDFEDVDMTESGRAGRRDSTSVDSGRDEEPVKEEGLRT